MTTSPTFQNKNWCSFFMLLALSVFTVTLMTTRMLLIQPDLCKECGLKMCNRTDLACLASHTAVATPASRDKAVILCILDEHYVDNFLNFAESAERASVHNLLPSTITEAAYKALDTRGITSYFSPLWRRAAGTSESKFGSAGFNLKGGMKSQIAVSLLRLGYSVLVLDLDTFIVQDPFPYMNCLECDFEVATTRDTRFGGNMCIGVVFFRPTQNMLDLLTTQIGHLKRNPKEWDQLLFSNLATKYRDKGNIKYRLLPFELFPNGFDFKYLKVDIFQFNVYMQVVIFHNNLASDVAKKQYRAKETGTWLLDKNGYYSSTTAKYITYENPLVKPRGTQIASLTIALQLAKSLKRILILPQFYCREKKVQIKCSLEHMMDVNKFHDMTPVGSYREHYFLRHFKVPKEVLASTTAPILFLTRKTEVLKLHSQSILVFRHADGRAPSIGDIKNWLEPYRNVSIIKLHSIYFSLNREGVHLSTGCKADPT